MHIKIKKSELLPILYKIQGITGRETNLPITHTVKIEAETTARILTVRATDLETVYEGFCEAEEILEGGEIAVSSRKLFEIVKGLAGDIVEIVNNESYWIEITDGSASFNIVGANPDDFPDVLMGDGFAYFPIQSQELKTLAEKAMGVPGDIKDPRAHLSGALMFRERNGAHDLLKIVAMDGGHVGVVEYDSQQIITTEVEGKIIIHKRGLSEIVKFLKDHTGAVWIRTTEGRVIISKQYGAERLSIRLLEGEFPDHQKIINADRGVTQYTVSRDKLIGVLKRMSILLSGEHPGALFRLSLGKLTIKATNPEIGESSESIPVEYDGEDIEALYNVKTFMSLVGEVSDPKVLICPKGVAQPCLIEGVDDKSFRSAIMPMRM